VSRIEARLPGARGRLVPELCEMQPLLRDASQGADTIVWLASAPKLAPPSGGFWHDRAPRPEYRLPRTRETDSERKRFWDYCERLASLARRPGDLAAPTA
jgi:dehydrogenase/reductase SDR family member 12